MTVSPHPHPTDGQKANLSKVRDSGFRINGVKVILDCVRQSGLLRGAGGEGGGAFRENAAETL
jgi:hypothetical protein